METSNIVSIRDNPVDKALLRFGIHNALPVSAASALVERGDITLAKKFFMPTPDYIEYAELTPAGLSKWTDLEHQSIVFLSEGGVWTALIPFPRNRMASSYSQ